MPRSPQGSRHGAEHEPVRQLLRQRDDGEPLGIAEEGASARPSLPHARGGEAGGLRVDRGLVPADEDPRLTRLRQPRGIRGGRESRIGSRWVSTGLVEVHYLS